MSQSPKCQGGLRVSASTTQHIRTAHRTDSARPANAEPYEQPLELGLAQDELIRRQAEVAPHQRQQIESLGGIADESRGAAAECVAPEQREDEHAEAGYRRDRQGMRGDGETVSSYGEGRGCSTREGDIGDPS